MRSGLLGGEFHLILDRCAMPGGKDRARDPGFVHQRNDALKRYIFLGLAMGVDNGDFVGSEVERWH